MVQVRTQGGVDKWDMTLTHEVPSKDIARPPALIVPSVYGSADRES
jgi:hypothetical protein